MKGNWMQVFTERELLERFNEQFNEVFPLVQFGSLSYEAANVLESVDPIAYRQEFLNWLDSEDFADDPNSGNYVYQSDLDETEKGSE